MKKTTVLALGAATFIVLAPPAFAAPPAASSTPAAASASSAAPAARPASSHMTATQLVSAAQTKLKADSIYSGPVNRRRDAATIAAIRTFQTRNHLTVNGRLDASTRRALGI
jgi:peptidoglycan hydrolase-like protein with peptidoglycan-binding domain